MLFHKAGEIFRVGCPSMLCSGMVPVVDGKIGDHDGIVPGRCPWIGTRVVDDRADFARVEPGADSGSDRQSR
ncbi:hypothetical protein OG203_15125 [Nocardia sp. NBC_01499]|uniref:hypothetical protein n=1 Tax=Nocardia sp. NBC_01499 TaxID=2903597 RepID=UPI003870C67B